MRVLCAECFEQIGDIKKGTAVCSSCGHKYDISKRTTRFKIRLEGGYIKEELTVDDIVKSIRGGKIMADEYIASFDGPWIHIYDSPFAEYYKVKTDISKRGGLVIYKQKKKKISVITALASLLIISATINFIFLILFIIMNRRIALLITKITGE